MSGWSDPQKGGRAVGAALYPTLSSLLSTAPKPGMRATALDAPGSMLCASGGKWAGDPGRFASNTDANYVAYLAAIAAGSVFPAPEILVGPTPATAVAMSWGVGGYTQPPYWRPSVSNYMRNLFVYGAAGQVNGKYLGDDGVEVENAGYNISAPMYISPGSVFSLASDSGAVAAKNGCIYDAAGTIICPIATTKFTGGSNYLYTMPANGAYIRWSFPSLVGAQHFCGVDRSVPQNGIAFASFLGDSTMRGYGIAADVGGIPSGVCSSVGIPAHENLGVDGLRVTGVNGLTSKLKTTAVNSECTFILCGINDAVAEVPIGDATSADINEFNGALNAIGAIASNRVWQKFYFILPLNSISAAASVNLPLYHAAILDACKRWNIECIPLGNSGVLDFRSSTFIRQLCTQDGLHPTRYGQRICVDFIARYLR